MNETDLRESLRASLRESLRDLADAPLPPSDRVRIAEARARGARTRRARRAGTIAAVAATCVAVAGVAYTVSDRGTPANRHTAVAQGVAPGETRVAGALALRREASFGWLPSGYREIGMSVVSPSEDRYTWTLSAAGPGFHMGPADAPVRFGVRPPQQTTVPQNAIRITVGTMQGYWVSRPGRGTATLTWRLPSGFWATLDVGPQVSGDVQTIIRIALNIRYGENGALPNRGPVSFPVRIKGLDKTFRVTGLYATESESGAPGFGGELDGGTAPGAKGLSIAVTPAAEGDHVENDPTLARTTIAGHAVFYVRSGYPTYWVSDVQGYALRVTCTPEAFARLQGIGGIRGLISNLTVLPKGKGVPNPFA
ncbi:hypothetical protein [Actinomadura gamaensis]|uniref:Uncharacterized protein n=1 Tax=Actinomadura gamaensis TaxID=1763541 RepID=A0ABV9U8B4_9ACTN